MPTDGTILNATPSQHVERVGVAVPHDKDALDPDAPAALQHLVQERDAERQRAERAEARLRQAEREREHLRALMLTAHAEAAENELARRKIKQLNKRITNSTLWRLVKPFWWLEQRLRPPGDAGEEPQESEYGIAQQAYMKWIAAYDRLGRGDRGRSAGTSRRWRCGRGSRW